MIKKLLASVREYKRPTILTVILMIGEAAVETFIPFITADLVNKVEAGADMGVILRTGLLLVLMAFLSLTCGGLAGMTSAIASSGFAKNLRIDMFKKIQSYSFENIDRFSTSKGLGTRIVQASAVLGN